MDELYHVTSHGKAEWCANLYSLYHAKWVSNLWYDNPLLNSCIDVKYDTTTTELIYVPVLFLKGVVQLHVFHWVFLILKILCPLSERVMVINMTFVCKSDKGSISKIWPIRWKCHLAYGVINDEPLQGYLFTKVSGWFSWTGTYPYHLFKTFLLQANL